MTSEPFTSSDRRFPEAFGDSSQFPPEPHTHQPHYFDRPGLAWILACVLFAVAAAHWLPRLAEPAGRHSLLVAVGWSSAAPTKTVSLPQDAGSSRAPQQPPAQERLTAALFRQY